MSKKRRRKSTVGPLFAKAMERNTPFLTKAERTFLESFGNVIDPSMPDEMINDIMDAWWALGVDNGLRRKK